MSFMGIGIMLFSYQINDELIISNSLLSVSLLKVNCLAQSEPLEYTTNPVCAKTVEKLLRIIAIIIIIQNLFI